MEFAHQPCGCGILELDVLVAEEALTKAAALDEVEILLPPEEVGTQFGQMISHFTRVAGGEHGCVVSISQVLKASGVCQIDELVQVVRLVDGGEVVVVKVVGGELLDTGRLSPQQGAVFVISAMAVGQESHEGAGLRDLGGGIGGVFGVIAHHVPRHLADVAAGIGVVADEGDTLGRK